MPATTALFLPALIVNASGGVLALAFRRQRLTQLVLLLLALVLAGNDGAGGRNMAAALAFAPWLLLLVALIPEARWRARPQLLLGLLALLALTLTLSAPAHVLVAVSRPLRQALPGQQPLFGAALLAALSAVPCLWRWVRGGQVSEFASAVLLLLVAAAWLRYFHPNQWHALLGLAGLLAVFAVLFGSYQMAFIDTLSRLPNRRSLDEALARLGRDYALAMVDVDHFKQFNDNHGHAAGDTVLREVAAVLKRHGGGKAFRYGGEEFCLVFENRNPADAERACEEARQKLEARRIRVLPELRGARRKARVQYVSVTASFGLAIRSPAHVQPAEVLASADKALYRAKARGRNRVEVAR
ncbi:MAG: GGDEF domain-containing protein [Lysobacterales bacterium]